MGYRLGNPYSMLLLANAVFVSVLAVVASRFRDKRTTQGLVALLAGVGIWSLADAVRIGATTRSEILLWNKLTYVGVVLIPPAFLVFTAAYTDRDRWLQSRYVGGFVAISTVALAAALTNWRGLWRTRETALPGTAPPVLVEEFGLIHQLWDAYVLLVVVPLGFWMLGSQLRSEHNSPIFRRQVAIMLAGLCVPVVASALYVTGIVTFDPTPFGFAAVGVTMIVAMARYRLLDIAPIARDIILEHVDSGVLVVDSDDVVIDANARALDIFEITDDDLVGRSVADLAATTAGVPESLVTAEEASETVSIQRDDETYHYDVTVSPVETDGTRVGRVVLATDVTERVRRQDRLESQKQTLERQNERLDDFAAIVSHDLRNPIQIIEANLTLIDDAENEDRIEAIDDATDRMAELIDQLLTLARTGGGIEATEPTDVATVATQAWATVDSGNGTIDNRTTRTVAADRARLQQCFENLFRNSVEHGSTDSRPQVDDATEHGSGPSQTDGGAHDDSDGDGSTGDAAVTVTVDDLADGFYVEDDGPGFPEHVLAADESVVDNYRDEGRFGLQIVENVIEAHGWSLTICEGTDGGARFEIRTE